MPDGLAFDAVAKIDTMDRFTRRQLGLDKPVPAVNVNLFSGEPKYEANPVFEAEEATDHPL
jgi:hypothetical protein